MHGKLFEHTQVGVLAITFRKSNHVQTLHLDLLLALDPGCLEAAKQKNKSLKKIAGFFQKMKKYWSKFRSIKNTNRIDMQYVVAKLCFRTQISCKYTHTHATKPPAKRLSCRIEFGPGPLPKRETRHPILLLTCYWHRCLVIRGKLL